MATKTRWVAGLLLFFILAVAGTGFTQIGFDVEADSALLMEATSGQILFEKNIDKKYPPASLAKIMTMLLVMESVETGRAELDDVIIVSPRAAAIGGSQVWLKEGERFTLEQLMESIAIQSANDSCVAVAEYLAGNEDTFVKAMNDRAQQLGLKNSYFVNTNGLPKEDGTHEDYTTARDVAILSRMAVQHPQLLEWSKTWQKVFREQPYTLMTNTNGLVRTYEGCDGLKTGHTEAAGFHLVATAKRENLRLIAVVLGTKSKEAREIQAARLLDYGFRAFTMKKVLENGQDVGTVRVKNGVPEVIRAKAARDLEVLMPKGQTPQITTEIIAKDVEAPLSPGQEIGQVVAKTDGRELGRTPIKTPVRVEKAGLLTRIFRWVRDLFASIFRRG